jgi:hypothetical protein
MVFWLMLTNLLIITSNILNPEILQLYVMWKSGHSVQWNSFGIAETPDDGRLGPKHIVKRRSDRNSCIIDVFTCVWKIPQCLHTILLWGYVYIEAKEDILYDDSHPSPAVSLNLGDL